MVQCVRFPVWWIGFLHDETPGANLTNLTGYNMGFAWGVSSPLASNAFTLQLWNVFQGQECARRKGRLQKVEGLHPTGTRVDAEKSAVICGVTS
jgi:hypothetical protein